jgi:pyruvate dehydrogenase E2 component (dihydrolipoamide acetyltransferase)
MKISREIKLIADQYGIDINKVKGTGLEEEITSQDIENHIKENYLPKIKKESKIFGIRKIISERLSRSYREAVHVTLNMEVKMDRFAELQGELSKKQKKLSYTLLMLKPIARALNDFVDLNAALEENKIILYDNININLAIDSPIGLVTPVIRDVDKKSLQQLLVDYEELIEKSKSGQLKKINFMGGTFTITNLGMFGVDFFNPIINPPQIAILGINRITEKPIVENKEIKISKVIMLSLTFDHRAVDGALAAKFLDRLKFYLEDPEAINSWSENERNKDRE